MKVICINDDWSGEPMPSRTPKVGHTYTVVKQGVCSCGFCGNEIYELEEMEEDYEWIAKHFAPISDVSETEMIRNYKTETV